MPPRPALDGFRRPGGLATGAVIAVAALVVAIGVWLAQMPALPDCDDPATQRAIEALLQERKIRPAPLREVKATSSTGSERICAAQIEQPGAVIHLQYRLAWNGRTPQTSLGDMTAEARIDPAQLNEVKKAARDFLVLAKDAPATGRPPRFTDPAVRSLLDKVFDLARVEGAALAATDIAKAGEWFDAGDRVGAVYILAGTGVSDIGKLPNTTPAQQRAQLNVVEFAPEFARYLDFQVKLATIMASAEVKRAAAPQSEGPEAKSSDNARSTLAQSLTGALTSLAYEGLGDEWRRQRLAVLSKVAPDAAKALSAEQARAVRQHALTVATYVRNKAIQDGVRAMADVLAAP